ncbi:MAG TPA: SsrA-binding protein SmpB [Chloroflexota bacterium]
MAKAPGATASRGKAASGGGGSGKAAAPAERTLVTNRQAFHDYHIVETVEAGLALVGTEVKSIRGGNANLRDAYARAESGEIWLWNAHIAPFDQGNRWNHEPRRPRRLLLHTREIGRLAAKSKESGFTLVPLRLYDRRGRLKLELALAKGKRQYDKRAAIAERESKREIDRAVKEAYGRR